MPAAHIASANAAPCRMPPPGPESSQHTCRVSPVVPATPSVATPTAPISTASRISPWVPPMPCRQISGRRHALIYDVQHDRSSPVACAA